ncbi:MAG: hypothetical protein ACTHJ8_00275, partial [Mucilaginibacter sp.]
LEQQQIKYTYREDMSNLALDYSSNSSFNIDTDVSAGGALTQTLGVPASGKLTIDFAGSNGILFQSTGVKKRVIDNLADVEAVVLNRYASKAWPKEWVVISEIVLTDHATIIISTSSNNKIELGCSTQIDLNEIKLADPRLNLKLISEKGSSTKIFGANNLTPFYQVKGIYEPFLRNPQFRKRADITDDMDMSKITDLKFDPREIIN